MSFSLWVALDNSSSCIWTQICIWKTKVRLSFYCLQNKNESHCQGPREKKEKLRNTFFLCSWLQLVMNKLFSTKSILLCAENHNGNGNTSFHRDNSSDADSVFTLQPFFLSVETHWCPVAHYIYVYTEYIHTSHLNQKNILKLCSLWTHILQHFFGGDKMCYQEIWMLRQIGFVKKGKNIDRGKVQCWAVLPPTGKSINKTRLGEALAGKRLMAFIWQKDTNVKERGFEIFGNR